jgi:indole-3-glycerol phosphate synthase
MPPVDVASLVPSSRDFLQAVRTARKGIALVPCLGVEDAGREALRMAEADVAALALPLAGSAMAEAAAATRLPVLLLAPIKTPEEALSARGFGADAVLIDPEADAAARERAAKSARSTRMVALPFCRTVEEVERETAAGAKAVLISTPDLSSIAQLSRAIPRSIVIGWPNRPLDEDLRTLRGQIDALVVGVEVYGATGFERLVSELSP